MSIEALSEQYALKPNEELLLLARDWSQLTEKAQTALLEELGRRGLDRPITPPPSVQPVVRVAPVLSVEIHREPRWYDSQFIRFPFHLLLVYAAATTGAPRLASITEWLLRPMLPPDVLPSRYEFLIAHLFLFTFSLAFVGGMVIGNLRDRAANFVWILPAIVLIIRLLTYSAAGSVLNASSHSSFEYFFGSNFPIPDFPNSVLYPDASTAGAYVRFLAQLHVTAPFYASIAYGLGAFLSVRAGLADALERRLNAWT